VFGIENPSRNSSYPGFYLGFIFDLDVSKKSNVEYHWGIWKPAWVPTGWSFIILGNNIPIFIRCTPRPHHAVVMDDHFTE